MVTILVILSLLAIPVALWSMFRGSREIVLDEPTNVSYTPSRSSYAMAIPGKYPALRTRRSRVIKS